MIKVISPGLFSTVQDSGRYGFRDLGVSYAGFMDQKSANDANIIVGNHKDEALIEFTLKGPVIVFNDSYCISITGGDFNPMINGKKVEMYCQLRVKLGDTLEIGNTKNGARGYLSVQGGIKSENIFGSKSFSKDITSNEVLKKGDEILVLDNQVNKSFQNHNFKFSKNNLMHVFKGPEYSFLSEESLNKIFKNNFIIGINNRMAYHIEDKIEPGVGSIISSPVLPGTIQLTPSGNIIILHRDCQTSGGYPRILQLDKKSLNSLSQLIIGQKIGFKLVDFNK
tara:strand:+ start:22575 stop:23417 length:843 start_codon:yes stop_codon:yes gene_type:complete